MCQFFKANIDITIDSISSAEQLSPLLILYLITSSVVLLKVVIIASG